MSKPKPLSGEQLMQLIRTQQFRCALSGRKLNPQTASLNHIVPLVRGGQHDISNLQVLDHQVHRAKGVMTSEEFLSLCREVAQHNAPQTAADELQVQM